MDFRIHRGNAFEIRTIKNWKFGTKSMNSYTKFSWLFSIPSYSFQMRLQIDLASLLDTSISYNIVTFDLILMLKIINQTFFSVTTLQRPPPKLMLGKNSIIYTLQGVSSTLYLKLVANLSTLISAMCANFPSRKLLFCQKFNIHATMGSDIL